MCCPALTSSVLRAIVMNVLCICCRVPLKRAWNASRSFTHVASTSLCDENSGAPDVAVLSCCGMGVTNAAMSMASLSAQYMSKRTAPPSVSVDS